jgi:hypothetical protein
VRPRCRQCPTQQTRTPENIPLKTHLDDGVGHAGLAAQRGQPDHQLNGVDIVRDHHQLRLAALNQRGDVVEAVLHHQGLLLVGLLAAGARLGLGLKALALLLAVLGAVPGVF